MNSSIISRFYFFTKLTTLFILLLIIFTMLYFFYRAYSMQNSSDNIEKEFTLLKENYAKKNDLEKKNNEKINLLEKEIISTQNIIKNIDNQDSDFKEIQKKLDYLTIENEKLNDKLNSILGTIEYSQPQGKEKTHNDIQIKNISKMIILKLEEGGNFSNEVELLEDYKLESSKKSYIEKLKILSDQKYIGLNKIIVDFDNLSSIYIERDLINKNNNVFLKYLLKVVSIKPNQNLNIKNENVKIFVQVSNNLRIKKYDSVIDYLSTMKNNDIFISLLEDIKYHREISNILNKIVT